MSPGSNETIRVLHVDDDPDLAATTATFLEREDDRFEVATATTAGDGRARIASDDVDCVVSDYDMPGENGIEFLEAVREGHPDLPFILYTGKGREEVASEAISAGATDYLQKDGGEGQYAVLANRIGNAVEQYDARTELADREREDELRRTTARLDALFEESPDMITVHGTDGRIRDPNPQLLEQTGYDAAELTDMKIWELDQSIDPDGAHALREGMETGDRQRVESAYRRKDGSTFPVEVHVRRFRLDGDDLFIATARDITERKRFEEKITALHDAAQEIFQAETRNSVAEFVVEAGRDVLGMSINGVAAHDETDDVLRMIARTDWSYELLEEDPVFEPGESLAWDAFRTGETRHYDDVSTVPGRYNPDTPIRSEILVPLGDHGVLLIGSTGAGVFDEVDLSLAKTLATHAEAALDRVTNERELERQNERLEEFAGVVSHDLRNPLNVAQGRLELARAEHGSDHLDDVGAALERSQALVDDLLSLARAGDRVSDIEAVDLGAVTENCWHSVATAEATLACVTDRTIRADRSRLRQLVENLYRNAIEHGGTDVTVTVGDLADGFYVADDGPGIPADERDTVFDVGHSTGNGAAGFGLRIVQQIVEAHGWTISAAESESGGARFEITGVEFVEE